MRSKQRLLPRRVFHQRIERRRRSPALPALVDHDRHDRRQLRDSLVRLPVAIPDQTHIQEQPLAHEPFDCRLVFVQHVNVSRALRPRHFEQQVGLVGAQCLGNERRIHPADLPQVELRDQLWRQHGAELIGGEVWPREHLAKQAVVGVVGAHVA